MHFSKAPVTNLERPSNLALKPTLIKPPSSYHQPFLLNSCASTRSKDITMRYEIMVRYSHKGNNLLVDSQIFEYNPRAMQLADVADAYRSGQREDQDNALPLQHFNYVTRKILADFLNPYLQIYQGCNSHDKHSHPSI